MKPGVLPDCEKCGRTNERKMIALMTKFFGEILELPQEPGYVYLCPDCYERLVAPHIAQVHKLLHKHHAIAPEPATDQSDEEHQSEEEDG